MTKDTLPDLQGIVDEFNNLYSRIAERLSTLKPIDIESLPSILLENYKSVDALPEATSCVYFLTHPEQGFLYIGKSNNLKKRFYKYPSIFDSSQPEELFTHPALIHAVRLGNTKLSWLEVPPVFNELIEKTLIKALEPKWNGRGNMPSLHRKAWFDKPTEEERSLAARMWNKS
jgi:GIY-YIG catalytic domain